MPLHCVALLSGGLDSRVAIRLMQEQAVQVEALTFKTQFTCCQNQAAEAAEQLGVRLTVLQQGEDYIDIIRRPRFGYGRGANPCIDCRAYMFQHARRFMDHVGAQFVVSGEVVGQRPMSQKKRDLGLISCSSGLDDRLLRPLSAKLLPATLPERQGWIDRTKLCDFSGRSRKGIIRLARQLGIRDLPSPSTGCALTEVGFSRKVFDLIQFQPDSSSWDFQLLRMGRHFRISSDTKIVLGRNADENQQLKSLFQNAARESVTLMEPRHFVGPVAMIVGPRSENSIQAAMDLIQRHSKTLDLQTAQIQMTGPDPPTLIPFSTSTTANELHAITEKPTEMRHRPKLSRR